MSLNELEISGWIQKITIDKKRVADHRAVYDYSGAVTPEEAEEAISWASEFVKNIEGLL